MSEHYAFTFSTFLILKCLNKSYFLLELLIILSVLDDVTNLISLLKSNIIFPSEHM